MIGLREMALFTFLAVLCVLASDPGLVRPGTLQVACAVFALFIVLAGVRLFGNREEEELPVRRMSRREWRKNRLRIRTQRSIAYYGQLPPPDEE
jgi:hypothetical protein